MTKRDWPLGDAPWMAFGIEVISKPEWELLEDRLDLLKALYTQFAHITQQVMLHWDWSEHRTETE